MLANIVKGLDVTEPQSAKPAAVKPKGSMMREQEESETLGFMGLNEGEQAAIRQEFKAYF